MTHAFFKALLFLAAGSVILALHHEQNIFRMGGLWRKLPVPFWSMLLGSAALAALPLTSGFYSKDAILLTSWDYQHGGPWFWAVAAVAAFLTALYSTRLIAVVFFGPAQSEAHDESGPNMSLPLIVLAVLAVAGGWFGLAPVAAVLPDGGLEGVAHTGWLPWITAAIPIAGVAVGAYLFFVKRDLVERVAESAAGQGLRRFWFSGWGFDALYDAVIVTPFAALARWNKSDFVDWIFRALAATARGANQFLSVTQTGRLRWYAANMAFGLIVVLLIAVGLL